MTRRRLVWLALALVVVTLVGVVAAAVVVLPRYARQLALWQLQSITARPVTLQALDLSLTTGRLSVRGLRITDRDGGLLAELDRLEGRFHPASLLRLHLKLDTLTLSGGHVRIVRIGPNRFNISDLIERPSSGRRLLDVSVGQFTIDGGWVALEDRMLTPARTWKSDEIRLEARNVSTRERRGTAFGSTTIAGALVTVRVEDLQLAPIHLRAVVNVRDLDLRLAALYLPGNGPVRLQRGVLDAGLAIGVDAHDGTSLDADAVVSDVVVRRPDDPPDTATAAAPKLTVLVRELRQRPGVIALRYASVGGDLTVLDPAARPPRPLTFGGLTLTVSGVEDAARGSARIAAHADVPGGGEIDVSGTAGLTPRQADLRVRARGIELGAFARDLPIAGKLTGVATADIRVTLGDAGGLRLGVTGDAKIDRLAIADDTRTLGSVARLSVNGLGYTWPARVAVEQLALSEPSATIERDQAGALGIVALMRPAEPSATDVSSPGEGSPAPAPAAASRRVSPDVRIARLEIERGRAALQDAATGTRVAVERLGVSARNLAWPGPGGADVTVSATVAGAALSVRGTLDPGARRADLALGIRGAELALLQPWLPLSARVRGVLAQADLHVIASQGEALALAVNGDATIERLALTQGNATPLAVERAALKGLDYTFPSTLRAADLTLTAPAVAVERAAAGTINLTTLVRPAAPAGAPDAPATAPSPPDAPSRRPFEIALARLRIDDGRARVSDAATAASLEITRIGLTAGDVTWPTQGASQIRLSADVAAGRITARGSIDPAQRQGEIAVTVRAADLTTLQPWLPIVGTVRGVAHADLTATVNLAPFTLGLRGAAGIANLALLDGGRPLLTVAQLDLEAIDALWPASITLGRLRVREPWAQIDRTTQGELSLRALFRRRADRPAPALGSPVAAGAVPGLEMTVREAIFDNGGLNIVDDAVEPAARFEIRGSRLHLRNLTWPDRGPASIDFSTPMPGNGSIKATGSFTIEPTRMQIDTVLDQIDMGPARPYLPIDARVNGRLSGRVKLNGSFGEKITLLAEGDAAIDRLGFGDADRRLATVQRLELTGVRYQYPTSVRMRQVTVQKPWVLVERASTGALQLMAMIRRRPADRSTTTPSGSGPTATGASGASASASDPPAPAPAPSAPRLRIALNKLTLQDGFVRFVDRTTEPDYAEELSNITVTADSIGTNPRRYGTVDLHGVLASGHPLTVQGRLGSITGPRFIDVTVAVKDFPVPRLNPYLDHLSAWIARQGQLTAALHYKLDGDELEATNDVTLNGLDVEQGGRGAEVQRRLGLSLGLLVSLLKDREGNIHLNVPVHGSLTSPEFDYGEAAWGALRNLAIRLVAAPFSLIGKVLFTEDSRIETVNVDPVTFETARGAPTAQGTQQVGQLATFLSGSPGIRLRARPVTTVADVTALRRQALEERLGGADAAARRQAAIALYAEMFPRREPPADDEALLNDLAQETPTPPRALRELATARVSAVREALTKAGVADSRLEPAESRAAVESEGSPRVEFEIVR